MILIIAMFQVILYLAAAVLVVQSEIQKDKEKAAYMNYVNMQAAYYEKKKADAMKIPESFGESAVSKEQELSVKETTAYDRSIAKEWIKDHADFLTYKTEAPVNKKNERVFKITADSLNELSEAQKKQLVLLLLECYVNDIHEAVLDKDGNINCYYYLR